METRQDKRRSRTLLVTVLVACTAIYLHNTPEWILRFSVETRQNALKACENSKLCVYRH